MTDYDLDHSVCCIKGCDKDSVALGLCINHWRRNKLYGSPVARKRHAGMFIGLSPEQRFWLQVRKRPSGCWVWRSSKDRDGYGVFKGEIGGVLYVKAHRFSYVLHTGEHPGLRLVCHTCDNPECTNPEHLFLGSNAKNMADKIAKGRARVSRGEDAGHAILTEEQAKAILRDPRPYAEIGADYNVARATIGSIKQRVSWRHLDIAPVKAKRGSSRRGVSDKITPDIVRLIRTSKEAGKALAERYGVSEQTVCDIRKRRSWKHID